MSAASFQLVTDPDQLAAVAVPAAAAPALAVDTEFVRRTTFYARPGLLQISAGEGEFLVDLVAVPEPVALRPLFLATAPAKVMHSCSEDLDVLKRLFGAVPGSLVDTQVAAAMLGYPLQTSYQKLLKAALDIDVPKDETQSDWTARPLSDSQLSYAALDVHYLLPLWRRLEAELGARDRLHWLEEDCARLLADAARETSPADYYRQIGNAWRLRPASLDLLATLATWREVTSRQIDKPRSHVVPDNALLAIAQRRPETTAHLRAIAELHPASLRRYGEDLLRMVQASREKTAAQAAGRVVPLAAPLPREAKAALSALRDIAAQVAAGLGVEVEVLVRRRHLEAIIESVRAGTPSLPAALSGWRRPLVGDRLLEAAAARGAEIRGWAAEAVNGD